MVLSLLVAPSMNLNHPYKKLSFNDAQSSSYLKRDLSGQNPLVAMCTEMRRYIEASSNLSIQFSASVLIDALLQFYNTIMDICR
mmetsp:Transcript_17333/g.21907  ORF Transcript_17333/g.21907 Transcript_17333/m.21907 type:complete len:84 (+) Transcript_17333:34-285(+)